MSGGIRAELVVDADGTCPITETARETGTPTMSISRSVDPSAADTVTEEFLLDVGEAATEPSTEELREVFAYGSKRVYRFDRELGAGCPCEVVERFDCPVVDIHTHDGRLHVTFHADGVDHLRDIIESLRERFPTVDVRRLLRSTDSHDRQSLVFVDRGALTDRQREVLTTAHEMGYFDHPKGANAGEVAAALDIDPSMFAEHIAAAQSKLLDAVLE